MKLYTYLSTSDLRKQKGSFPGQPYPAGKKKPVVGLWLGKGFDQKGWVANPGWLPGCGVLSSPDDTDGYGWA